MGGPTRAQTHRHLAFINFLSVCFLALICCAVHAAQQSNATPSPQSAATSDKPEVNTHDSTLPLESRVNLVPLRVVVRDPAGHVITNLHKEDFQVFQDGRPQEISHFAVETPASFSQTVVHPDPSPEGVVDTEKKSADFIPPSRFVGLLVDDINTSLGDLMRTKDAAIKFVDTSVGPSDRVAVFTISGQSQTDFTSDHDKLHAALLGLTPRAVVAGSTTGIGQCPPIDYYQADLIVNKNDQQALTVATQDAMACAHLSSLQEAQPMALSAAMETYQAGETHTDYTFRRMQEILRRISSLPGQRNLVLLSPGFIYPGREYDLSQIIDRANHANVIINTLDARGLYTPDMGDIAQPDQGDPNASGPRSMYRQFALSADSDVLNVIADGTGGMAFHNNNDLTGGLRMLGSAPEVSYLLAFVPHNLKYDGRFHSLKVTLTSKQRVNIQARRGFYAPKHSISVEDAAKQDIEDALFSQEEQHGLPVELHTQYYKVDSMNAKLAVMMRVDIGHMRFEKTGDRNQNNLTIVTALFDRDGNIVTGVEKNVEMKLLDATLQRLSRTGLTVKTSFDVKPGDYVVRLVVRDSNAAQLSAENGVVQIPY